MKEKDEIKYEKVIKTLNSLQKVNAPAGFEADLRRKLNQEESLKEEKSFWGKMLLPARLIPSFGLVVAAMIILMVVNSNSEQMDNPFLIEPRVREDIVEVKDYDSFKKQEDEIVKEKSLREEKPKNEIHPLEKKNESKVEGKPQSGGNEMLMDDKIKEDILSRKDEGDVVTLKSTAPESTLTEGSITLEEPVTTSEVATGMAITKDELNFRQVQLNTEQQKEVDQLRMKVQNQSVENKEKRNK